MLLFDTDERGPDETLKLKFEALRQFDPAERVIAEGVLDSLIVQHQAKRVFTPATIAAPQAPIRNAPRRASKRASR